MRDATPNEQRLYKEIVRPRLGKTAPEKGRMYEVNLDISPEEMLQFERPYSQQPEYVQRALKDHVMGVAKRQQEAALSLLKRYPTGTRHGGPPRNKIEMHNAEADVRKWTEITNKEIEELAAGKTGKALYESAGMPAVDRAEGYVKSTAKMLDMGVNGLRYLDAGSRPNIYQTERGWMMELNDKKHGPYKTVEQAMKVADQKATYNYVIFDDRLIKILRKYGIAVPGAAGAAASMGSLAPAEEM